MMILKIIALEIKVIYACALLESICQFLKTVSSNVALIYF